MNQIQPPFNNQLYQDPYYINRVKPEVLESNRNYIPKLNNFFFCYSPNNVARFCCCGCNLKVGVIIICVLGFIQLLAETLSMNMRLSVIPLSVLSATFLIAYIFLMISIFDYRASFAYCSYMTLCVLFIIKFIVYVIIVILLGVYTSQWDFSTNNFQYPFYIIIAYYVVFYLIDLSLTYYYLWIIYSYARNLASVNFAANDGIYQSVSQPELEIVVVPGGGYQGTVKNVVQRNNGNFDNNPPKQIEIKTTQNENLSTDYHGDPVQQGPFTNYKVDKFNDFTPAAFNQEADMRSVNQNNYPNLPPTVNNNGKPSNN